MLGIQPDIIRTGQVTIGTSPTLIVDKNSGRARVIIVLAEDNKDLYTGDENVTTSTGSLVVEGRGNPDTYLISSALYGVVASGTLLVTWRSEDFF